MVETVVIRSTDCENQLLKKEIKFRDKTQEGPTAGLKGTVGEDKQHALKGQFGGTNIKA